jgi:hypothetical protein
MNSLIINYTRELRMYFKQQKSSQNTEDDSFMFNTIQTFLQYKYDLTNSENEILFQRWIRKMIHFTEVKIEIPQEIEILRGSHLSILYIIPDNPTTNFSDEFFKISYLRNSVFGVPFMWMTYNQLLIQDSSDNKPFACKLKYHLTKSIRSRVKLSSYFLLSYFISEFR